MVNLVAAKKAATCFVGAWGFINSTLLNTTSGNIITEDWAYPVPSGASLFTPNGYTALLVTPNDTAKPDLRPRYLTQNDYASGNDTEWAKLGKYSIAGVGPYHLSNVTWPGYDCGDKGSHGGRGEDEEANEHFEGPEGTQTGTFFSSTLPSREGPYEFTFKFHESCRVWNLHQPVGGGLERIAWYEKLPDQQVY
ncbi:hypothetical protein PG993_004071 [Apiospora rasikravindrae]|uniref:Lipocalin-like domain-containing protein n=1 Tax=Apiospora rasikravindrae TaxID=990691 RepID=A0ABR1TCA5_9PEZI